MNAIYSKYLKNFNCIKLTLVLWLTESVYREEMLTKKNYLAEIRKAIRLSKNRHYKDACLRKKAQHSFLTDEHSNSSSNGENITAYSNSKETMYISFQ